jgi:hypothetical protein
MRVNLAIASAIDKLGWSARAYSRVLQFGWSLTGILSAISALMLWRWVTNLHRFLSRKWAN